MIIRVLEPRNVPETLKNLNVEGSRNTTLTLRTILLGSYNHGHLRVSVEGYPSAVESRRAAIAEMER